MTPLSEKQLTELRQTLLTSKEELEELLRISESSADTVSLDQSKVGRVSRVDALQQQAMAQANRETYKKRLVMVNKALAKMGGDDYGFCEVCDEDIAFARLQIRPESSLCIACQEKKESP